MFGTKKAGQESGKLSGPRAIPDLVQKYLIADKKAEPELVPLLKAIIRKTGETSSEIRIFDQSDALARKVEVKDYTSLDEHPELVLYEGSFDEASKRVELEEKKRITAKTTLFTEDEIRQKIEGLSEPGSTVFFYLAAGFAHGGPLGVGATVIELNPNYPGKKGKKYNIYSADVVDLQPLGKGQRLFDSNKPKDIARWVKEGHYKRTY